MWLKGLSVESDFEKVLFIYDKTNLLYLLPVVLWMFTCAIFAFPGLLLFFLSYLVCNDWQVGLDQKTITQHTIAPDSGP